MDVGRAERAVRAMGRCRAAIFSCRSRAVPRARVAAQARPADSGRAGAGPTATVLGRASAGPKQQAVGHANGPRAIWKSIVFRARSGRIV